MRAWALALAAVVPWTAPAAADHPDRVLASKTIRGALARFQWGDYLHAYVRTDAAPGEELDFFVGLEDSCYLALNKGKPLEIEYDEVLRYFEEGGGYSPAAVIRQIRVAGGDFLSWKRTLVEPRAALIERCEREIERSLAR